MMNSYSKKNNLIGWVVWAIATLVYLATIEPTASFWDCGEYILSCYKLEVGHPPGAPFFILLGRFFTLFAGGDVMNAAMWVNVMSGLSSSFTILFLFWTITALGRKLSGNAEEPDTSSQILIFGSGIVGALAYTFSDSFWFSAVEGEVYAMSSLFTALVFWAIFKWDKADDDDMKNNTSNSVKWLILISYMMGLSIGVHLLNLLAIPAIVLLYYFKKSKFTPKGFAIAFGVSILLLGAVQNVIIPGIVNLAAHFDLKFVNGFGLPFNSGMLFYFVLLLGIIITGIFYSIRQSQKEYKVFFGLSALMVVLSLICSPTGKDMVLRLILGGIALGLIHYLRNRHAILNTVLISFFVLLVGYSSFFVLVIRSQSDTPMDQNNPENPISLLSYLKREQYGDWPILYGQNFNTPLMNRDEDGDGSPDVYKDGDPVYMKDEKLGKYVVKDDRKKDIPNYHPDFCSFFPRMWSQQSNHENAYRIWSNLKGKKMPYQNPFTGQTDMIEKPTFADQLAYFFKYQVGHMYMRYFLWNFAGRQNDIQGHGINPEWRIEGNWISGIPALDAARLGPQDRLPESVVNNKANNKFYCLPLILGLFGMVFHFGKKWQDATVVTLLFLMTGLAIVFYLNQYPYQPRERDYAYAASFYAFAIWIGLGIFALADLIKKKSNLISLGIIAISTVAVPGLMAQQGWDDHNRSKRYTARDFAKDYLASCEKNAILFTNGDNDTFPLWYVQEVEGYRTDVRVVNLSLAQTDWYINQMRRQAYDSKPIPGTLSIDKYIQGKRDIVPVRERKELAGYQNLKEVMDFVGKDDEKYMIMLGDELRNYIPTKKFRIPVDKETALRTGTITEADTANLLPALDWEINKTYVYKNDLLILDILSANNWERPVYFSITTGSDAYLSLMPFFRLEGLAYRLVPLRNVAGRGQINVNTEKMFKNIMEDYKWGGLDENEIYMDENNIRMAETMRVQMVTLANALTKEGKKDKALAVLKKCLQVLPERNVPLFNEPYEYKLYLVQALYEAGGNEDAARIAKRFFQILEGDLAYLNSFKGSEKSKVSKELYRKAGMMNELIVLAGDNQDDATKKELEQRFKPYEMYLIQEGPREGPPGQ
jgi:tetratricopeptide (TPR) repeat protein